MKIALVHDFLNSKLGGGEQVLLEFAKLYPEAPIYCLTFDALTYQGKLEAARVQTSFLQKLPSAVKTRPRYLLPLAPMAVESFDLSGYDIVISTSSAFAKSVITSPSTTHICYCFSPMRYVWDYWPKYIVEQAVGPFRRAIIHLLVSKLRIWDYYSSARVDLWVAISKTVSARINKYYRQPSQLIYPPVDTKAYAPRAKDTHQPYYVTLASLTPYKKIDLAIEACNTSKRRLIVIGDGPDRARLEAMAGPTIHFAGLVDQASKAKLLAEAKGLIFANEEDFGIAPVEAMASGTPVIAFGRGGVTETVIAGKTGLFFDTQSAQSLNDCLDIFEKSNFEQVDLIKHAQEFSKQKFIKAVSTLVEDIYGQK